MLPPIITLTSSSGSIILLKFGFSEYGRQGRVWSLTSPRGVLCFPEKRLRCAALLSALYMSGVEQTLRPVVSGIMLMDGMWYSQLLIFPESPDVASWLTPQMASHTLTATWEMGGMVGIKHIYCILYLTRSSLVTQLVKNPPAMHKTLVQFLGQEDPLQKG